MTGKDTAVVIAAAGSGTRFGSALPKQFCLLEGLPVAFHAIRRFRAILPEAQIIAVTSPDRIEYWHELCRRYSMGHVTAVAGGDTRWQSVKNALDTLRDNIHTVYIHDGARPLVERDVVLRLAEMMNHEDCDGALPVLPLTDSIRELNHSGSLAADRSRFVAVQTPQVFNRRKLTDAYSRPCSPSFTDDASVMEAAGYTSIRITEGSRSTMKITAPTDIEIAALFLKK